MNCEKNVIELSNIEIYEHCILNLRTGEKEYNIGKKKIPHFTGVYFKDENTFFALYPSEDGPMMYYQEKEYQLKKDLHIFIKKMGDWREFSIQEYEINIKYRTSKYIGFDVWSEEEDVDLFYQIEQSYKKEEYYRKFTKKIKTAD